MPTPKRVPKPWAGIGYLLLLIVTFALFMGRSIPTLRSQAILGVAPDFYTHVSNFSISWLLYTAIGYQWLMSGAGLKPIVWLGVVMLLANIVYELFIPLLNTRDPVDAIYGVAGTALAFLVLWIMDRYGLVPNPKAGRV